MMVSDVRAFENALKAQIFDLCTSPNVILFRRKWSPLYLSQKRLSHLQIVGCEWNNLFRKCKYKMTYFKFFFLHTFSISYRRKSGWVLINSSSSLKEKTSIISRKSANIKCLDRSKPGRLVTDFDLLLQTEEFINHHEKGRFKILGFSLFLRHFRFLIEENLVDY